jgi:hypothetical protein
MVMKNGDSHKLKRLKSAKGPNCRHYKNIVALFFPLSALSLIHIFFSKKKNSQKKKGDAQTHWVMILHV